jgi:hypothetical protein
MDRQDACPTNPKPNPLMKQFLFAASLLVMGSTVQAQDALTELVRADIRLEKRAILAANLPLTEEQGKAFWPLYDQYSAANKLVWDKRLKLIDDYAASFATMTDDKAASLMKQSFALDKEMLKVRESWSKRLNKVLPATTVARFVQVENQLENILNTQVREAIPLMEPKK